jgi:H+/Cl- antiporter ClcA
MASDPPDTPDGAAASGLASRLRLLQVQLIRLALWRLRRAWRVLRGVEPEVWRRLFREARLGPHWWDRVVVLSYAVLTGLVVVGFTYAAEGGMHVFLQLTSATPLGPVLALLWTPLITVALLCLDPALRAGSGRLGYSAGHVRAMDDDTPPTGASRQPGFSLRLALHKVGLVSGGLLGGLSIGREGPTVQVGAGVMLHALALALAAVREWMHMT